MNNTKTSDLETIPAKHNSKRSCVCIEEIQHQQPVINIGMIGHVAHGKSTVVRQITGVRTAMHSKEQERNMTIKLGYANAKIFSCCCPKPSCFKAFESSIQDSPTCSKCKQQMVLLRHVSFIDCPGHEVLMATMLNATASMHAAILVVAANEDTFPAPQTAEHLAAAELSGLKHILTVQNKLDLVSTAQAKLNERAIREFVKNTVAEHSPLIPIAAQHGINIDVLCQYIVERIPFPLHDVDSPFLMQALRSFDINKPGTPYSQLNGGVIGGTLSRGRLKIGDFIEIRPGIVRVDDKGNHRVFPLFTTVTSISSEKNQLEQASPGGLIGVGTKLDPVLTKDDGLAGQTLGPIGALPEVYQTIKIEYIMLKRLNPGEAVVPLKKKDQILLHHNAMTTRGFVLSLSRNGKKRTAIVHLTQLPICAQQGDRVAFSRLTDNHSWRLIGMGTLMESVPLELEFSYRGHQ